MIEREQIQELVADFPEDSTNLKPWNYTSPTMDEWEQLREGYWRDVRDLEAAIRIFDQQD